MIQRRSERRTNQRQSDGEDLKQLQRLSSDQRASSNCRSHTKQAFISAREADVAMCIETLLRHCGNERNSDSIRGRFFCLFFVLVQKYFHLKNTFLIVHMRK